MSHAADEAGHPPPTPAWPADSCSSSRSRGPATKLRCRRSLGQGGRRLAARGAVGQASAGTAAGGAACLGSIAGHTRKHVSGGLLATSSRSSVNITNSYTSKPFNPRLLWRIFQITKVLLSSKHQSSWWLLTKALAATDDTTNAEALAPLLPCSTLSGARSTTMTSTWLPAPPSPLIATIINPSCPLCFPMQGAISRLEAWMSWLCSVAIWLSGAIG